MTITVREAVYRTNDGIRVHPDGRVEKSNPDSNLPGYHNWELLETLEVDK